MAARFYAVGMVVVGGLLLGAVTQDSPWLEPKEVKQELVKIGLQVFVFALAGGGVKLLLDRQTELRTFRTDMLERLGKAHKDVYRVRRLLKAGSTRTEELLGELMDARQELGAAFHFSRGWGEEPGLEQARREMRGMRAYLETVIDAAFADPATAARAPYDDFLKWQSDGAYKKEFKDRYVRAKKAVDPSFRPAPG